MWLEPVTGVLDRTDAECHLTQQSVMTPWLPFPGTHTPGALREGTDHLLDTCRGQVQGTCRGPFCPHCSGVPGDPAMHYFNLGYMASGHQWTCGINTQYKRQDLPNFQEEESSFHHSPTRAAAGPGLAARARAQHGHRSQNSACEDGCTPPRQKITPLQPLWDICPRTRPHASMQDKQEPAHCSRENILALASLGRMLQILRLAQELGGTKGSESR